MLPRPEALPPRASIPSHELTLDLAILGRTITLSPVPKRRAVLNARAHAKRHSPTPSEAALFQLVSGGKLGVGFKRQVPLGGRYICDFVAASAKLLVERSSRCSALLLLFLALQFEGYLESPVA